MVLPLLSSAPPLPSPPQVFGEYARAIEHMSSEQVARDATAALRSFFFPPTATDATDATDTTDAPDAPDASKPRMRVPDAIGCVHSKWSEEAFSAGSWTFWKLLKRRRDKEGWEERRKDEDGDGDGNGDLDGEGEEEKGGEGEGAFDRQGCDATTTTGETIENLSEDSNENSNEDSAERSNKGARCEETDSWSDVLFYAGEAKSIDNRGTVHGAFISGDKEAQRLLASLDTV